jgi:glycerol-3-phosphate dehydrogenase
MLAGPSWTLEKPLPGGDFPMDGAEALCSRFATLYPFLPMPLIRRLVRSYGTSAQKWIGEAKAIADLGTDFGHGLYAAEVDYLIDQEWAQSADDILWRRSKLGLRFDSAQAAALDAYVLSKR